MASAVGRQANNDLILGMTESRAQDHAGRHGMEFMYVTVDTGVRHGHFATAKPGWPVSQRHFGG